MHKEVSEQKLNDFLFNDIKDFSMVKDIWNKSGSVVIRRFKSSKTGKIVASITNWKKYHILTHNL